MLEPLPIRTVKIRDGKKLGLEQIFEELDQSRKGRTCHSMKGLTEEGFTR